jgi:hypothetical protein
MLDKFLPKMQQKRNSCNNFNHEKCGATTIWVCVIKKKPLLIICKDLLGPNLLVRQTCEISIFWTQECSRLIKEILHYWQIPSWGWAGGYMAKPINGVGRSEIQALHLLGVFRSSIWWLTIWWARNMNERKTLNSNLMDDLLWTF